MASRNAWKVEGLWTSVQGASGAVLLVGLELAAREAARHVLAVSEVGVDAPGFGVRADDEGARARGRRADPCADLEAQVARAIECAADLVGAGALVAGIDLDVEDEVLAVQVGDRKSVV